MIVDYYLLRQQRLDVQDLYTPQGQYWYTNGFNTRALAAFALGWAPTLPGFLKGLLPAAAAAGIPQGFAELYNFSWFVGVGLGGGVYYLISPACVASCPEVGHREKPDPELDETLLAAEQEEKEGDCRL
jgi:nucleobase:cation symporter-1, NCS1 family